MLEVFTFLQKLVNLKFKTQHAVITHANTSNVIKIPTFFGKKWGGDDVILVQCPFNFFDLLRLKQYHISVHWTSIYGVQSSREFTDKALLPVFDSCGIASLMPSTRSDAPAR